jgi:hypothetical protein
MDLFKKDLEELARRYANDPRIDAITVQGHNYKGEEMHAPDPALLDPYGINYDTVLANWKWWIDLYGALFQQKKLILVVSQMYNGSSYSNLPEDVTEYFARKYQGRAILQTDQLDGRRAKPENDLSSGILRRWHDYAPNRHEMVGSFKEQPERQGTPEMTIYNFVGMGNPYSLQLWRRDCDIPLYAENLLNAWIEYGRMTEPELKARLQADGKWIENIDNTPVDNS